MAGEIPGPVLQFENGAPGETGYSEESDFMPGDWPQYLVLAPVAGVGPSSWCWPQ